MITFKNLIFTSIILFSNFSWGTEFNCEPTDQINWERLADGVEWTKYELAFTPYFKDKHAWATTKSKKVTVRAFKIDYALNQLLFHRSAKDLVCNPAGEVYIKKLIDDSKSPVIGAVNANFFVMPNGNILGIAIDEKKAWSKKLDNLAISSAGVLSIQNGITALEARDQLVSRHGNVISNADATKYSFAVQGYPKLVNNDTIQISDAVKDVKVPRTSIGFAKNQNDLYLVTINADDFGGEITQYGMTLFEYAHFIKDARCGVGQKNVLNLDGGGSTAFAIPSKKIFHQADRCRHLGNILTIQSRSKQN